VAGNERNMIVYVGCYTTPDRSGRGEGITAYRMDADSGDWQPLGVVASVPNPSYLGVHSSGPYLYCVHGGLLSDLSAFEIGDGDGAHALAALGTWPSGGENPVHLDVHPTGKWMVVANYTGSTIAVVPVQADGQLGKLSDLVTLSGECGPDPVQQASSHPHDIPLDPSATFVVVPDKGLDRVFVFRVDSAAGKFVPANPPSVPSAPGAGPRHVAFHPEQPWAYVVNELNSTITAYQFAPGGDGFVAVQTVSSVPADAGIHNTGSEIAVHPAGRVMYVSNRGHDSIAVYEISQADGSLSPRTWVPTGGKTPRAFELDPSGRFLYAANQASDTIVAFRVLGSGNLEPTGQVVATGSPSSLAFVAPR
jgi:6-phosphogluconolactonase (cycloisomerase 2 family)